MRSDTSGGRDQNLRAVFGGGATHARHSDYTKEGELKEEGEESEIYA